MSEKTKRDNNIVIIDIGKDFGRFPGGRLRASAKLSGEEFRQRFMEEELKNDKVLKVLMDNVISYGSSFLDEAFAGLVRHGALKVNSLDEFTKRVIIETSKPELKKQINFFVKNEIERKVNE